MTEKSRIKPLLRASAQTSTLIGLLAIALTWLGIFTYLAERKSQVIDAATQNAQNLTLAFEEQIVDTIRSVDQALLFVRAQYARDPAHFNLDDWSKNSYFTNDVTVQMALIGADGFMVSSNASSDKSARVDLHDREHFQFHVKNPKDELFVSKPVLGRVTGKWTVQLTRKVLGADGSFAGVLVASLDPYYLSRIYSSFKIGSGGSIMLLGEDGVIRAMDGLTSDELGKSLSNTHRFRRFAASPTGFFVSTDKKSGAKKLTAFRHVRNLPLVVTTSLDEREVLKSFGENEQFLWRTGVGLTALIAAAVLWSIMQRASLDTMRGQLVDKTRLLGLALSNMDEGILMIDAQGDVVVINDQAKRLLDMPEGLVCPFPSDQLPLRAWGQRPVEIGAAVSLDASLDISEVTSLAGRILEIHSIDLPEGGAVKTIWDRTNDRIAERELVDARDRAEEASRARAAFLATMSHEIRTPLGAVISMADLLKDTTLDRDQRWYVGIARESAEHLLQLLDDILDISKFETGQMKLESIAFDFPQLLQKGVEMFAQKAREKELSLAVLVDPNLPKKMMGDQGRLRQIVINLVGNALKFTDRGHVLVRASKIDGADGAAAVQIDVEDTGIGISPEGQKSLFQDFRQVDASINRRFGGTGLGLAICKKLALKMGGSIKVTSELGKGALFTVVLPLAATEELGEPALKSASNACIALVGPNSFERTILSRQLELCGAHVRSFHNMDDVVGWFEDGSNFALSPIVIHLGAASASHIVRPATTFRTGRIGVIRVVSADQIDDGCGPSGSCCDRILITPVAPEALIDAVAAVMRADADGSQVAPPAEKAAPAQEQPLGLRILLAEDNVTNQFAIKSILNKLGAASVVAVENGRLAVEALQGQTFDLVLMDMMMPVLDGLAAAREIRSLPGPLAQIPIIALTANAFPEDREATRQAGMNAFATKPTTRARLRAVIEEVFPRQKATASAASNENTKAEASPSFDAETFSGLCRDLGVAEAQEALRLFFTDSAERFERLRNGDAQAIRQEAHAMKSSSAMFGLSAFSRECQRVEQIARSGRMPDETDLETLTQTFQDARRQSHDLLQAEDAA